jgi:formylglycine-generating enzyme required for sulfatase activity/uncharacterized caspase-like protein
MSKAKNWAIVIGINAYDNMGRLNYANRDAEAMQNFFNEAEFDRVFCFVDELKVSPRSDQKSTRPRSSDLVDFLHDRFTTNNPPLNSGDNCWFFFAGHGKRIHDRDYLLPQDYNPRLSNHADRAISVDFVREALLKSGADSVILLLDACRTEGERSDGLSIGDEQPGAITIFSCQRNQKAYEIEALQQGAFTVGLLEGLRMQGERNCATVKRLDLHLQKCVPQICRTYNKPEQTPTTSVDPWQKLDLILLPKYATQSDIDTLKTQALKTAQFDENLDLAEQLWLRILAASQGVDPEAVKALQKIAIQRANDSNLISGSNAQSIARIPNSLKISNSLPNRSSTSSERKGNLNSITEKKTQTLKHLDQKFFSQMSKSIASQLQEFIFDVSEVDSYGKTISQYTGKNWFIVERVNEEAIEMVVVPGGSFLMGSSESEGQGYKNERPQHKVEVEPFLMSKFPVTFAQWKAIAQMQPIHRKLKVRPSRHWGNNRPVIEISWRDAVEFCDRLSQRTGHSYRLPTEAEWEYACRAGTTTPFHFGQTITSDLANYDGTHTYCLEPKGINRAKTLQVGELKFANAFGLFDMHGNVWEWCQDHWHTDYNGAPLNGAAWIDSTNNNQNYVIRGGSWLNESSNCRSSYRLWKNSDQVSNHIGFRIVRSL